MSDAFSRRHPLINFIYFTLIIGFSMFLMHPLCLAISLLGAVSYALCLKGKKSAALSCLRHAPSVAGDSLAESAF
jgi:energy-coupling factor transport system permease protein